jgi:hypothetical protein
MESMGMRCPYYFNHTKQIRSSTASESVGQAVSWEWTSIPYCLHKHSPAPRGLMNITEANVLKCGGDLAKCQIPVDKRLDVS